MLILLVLLLVASLTLARIPYMCTEFRYETKQEAELRRTYERCIEACDESSSGVTSCTNCAIPYSGYGCLRQRQEDGTNCFLDCDLLLPDRMAQLQCMESCNLAKFFL
ncbi:hypothetical protein Q1695_007097 [Nippostrongylus brasiliensis]|nr:hypothetical protein Q1695_007097 [Nippostrongylus brasiliensis]